MERDILIALRHALDVAIEKSEENVLDLIRDESGELVLR